MHATMSKLRAKRAGKTEEGFTLIELLVVVVIIGILVGIAIPVYLNFRKGAENRSAQSDVRNAVASVEQCFNDSGQSLPAGFTVAPSASNSLTCGTSTQTVSSSAGNTLTYTPVTTASANTYTIASKNADTGKTFTYDSTTGKIS